MALDTDELEPRRPVLAPRDLEADSIDDLKEYIAELQAEIARAEEMIAAKQAQRSSAEGLFKF